MGVMRRISGGKGAAAEGGAGLFHLLETRQEREGCSGWKGGCQAIRRPETKQ